LILVIVIVLAVSGASDMYFVKVQQGKKLATGQLSLQ